MTETINVCLSCDDNYSQYAGVVIASILNHASSREITIFILDGGISSENKRKIEEITSLKKCNLQFVSIADEDMSEFKRIQTHAYISIPTFFRLKLASLLPQVTKVLYLDCDVIVNSPLDSLFDLEIGEYWGAGVQDINPRKVRKQPNYFNAGVLLVNLNQWREDNVERAIKDYVEKNFHKIKLGDQEILNDVLEGKVKIIDEEWNVQSSNFVNRSSYTKKPRIIHFVSNRKPWNKNSLSIHQKLYVENLQLTPWRMPQTQYLEWEKHYKVRMVINYVKHRPLFFLRPRFYKALFCHYF